MSQIFLKGLGTLGALALVAIHLGGAYLGLDCLNNSSTCPYPFALDVPEPLSTQFLVELFKQALLVGAFLYSLLLAYWCLARRPASVLKSVAGVFAMSLGIAVLLAADSSLKPESTGTTPTTWSGLIYTLATERQALLALSLMLVTGVVLSTYYLLRSAFAVEYTGAGVQIKLPGHTVYYVPIYPQVSWRDTGITLQKGEKVSIEVSGLVSPGALHSTVLSAWTKHMEAFVKWQREKKTLEDLRKIERPAMWPYTGPEGYRTEWYEEETMLPILKKHDLYQQHNFYEKDELLTVQGLPHNTVIGYIQAFGAAPPKNTEKGEPAYNWNQDEDKKQLLLLSARDYPLTDREIPRSGKLWVVINDVDFARWDNAGMFFLKLTRRAWL